ncbi:MAG TPA: SRPBCC family protein [Solirubrobacterales bacterium]|nr:SRPBCC family protein [Solirubrobacterales bacterium]
MGPWFKAKPVDESFFESAPMRLRGSFEVAQSAEKVWAELTADDALHWCRILQDVSWTSPRPFGVGTTREVKALQGANLLREHYFLWEEGRRHSFYVVESTSPLFSALAEDYLVEPLGTDVCRFTWTIAVELTALGRASKPVNRAILKTLFTDTARHYGLGQTKPA